MTKDEFCESQDLQLLQGSRTGSDAVVTSADKEPIDVF